MKLKLTVSLLLIAVLITACGGANPPQEQEPTPDVAEEYWSVPPERS